jgi:hypothetical protein
MTWLSNLDLIRFFEFYLTVAFVLSTAMRIRQYEAIIKLVRAVPDRWPRLLALVRQHHSIFLSGSTILPGLLALGLCLVNSLACRLVWPDARLTVGTLREIWSAVPFLVLFGVAMLAVDTYATFTVGCIDRSMLEEYFDQAEYWLRSWTAPVIRVFTLGYINPRQMVAVEVRKALLAASQLLNVTLWWVTAQVALRIAFGLALWLSWAFS